MLDCSRFYLDNTILHRLLSLARRDIPFLVAGRVPAEAARALECLLLADEVLINSLEPTEINSPTLEILEWLGESNLTTNTSSLTLKGQQAAVDAAGAEMLLLIERARNSTFSAVIPAIQELNRKWQDVVPVNAGRSDWRPLWRILDESSRVRQEVAESWIEEELSGKLLFSNWCMDEQRTEFLRRLSSWLKERSRDELDGLHLLFFVLLNQHLSRDHDATYATTVMRSQLAVDSRSCLYHALCSKLASLRQEVRSEVGALETNQRIASEGPCYPLGLIDVLLRGRSTRSGVSCGELPALLVEFRQSDELIDLRRAIGRVGALAANGEDELAMAETIRELRDIEEGVRRRLQLPSLMSRRIDVEHGNWRTLAVALLREPGRFVHALRQERTIRSPRVAMLTRAVAG